METSLSEIKNLKMNSIFNFVFRIQNCYLIAPTENKSWRSSGRLSCSFPFQDWAQPLPCPLPCESLISRSLQSTVTSQSFTPSGTSLSFRRSVLSITASSENFVVSKEGKEVLEFVLMWAGDITISRLPRAFKTPYCNSKRTDHDLMCGSCRYLIAVIVHQ